MTGLIDTWVSHCHLPVDMPSRGIFYTGLFAHLRCRKASMLSCKFEGPRPEHFRLFCAAASAAYRIPPHWYGWCLHDGKGVDTSQRENRTNSTRNPADSCIQ